MMPVDNVVFTRAVAFTYRFLPSTTQRGKVGHHAASKPFYLYIAQPKEKSDQTVTFWLWTYYFIF